MIPNIAQSIVHNFDPCWFALSLHKRNITLQQHVLPESKDPGGTSADKTETASRQYRAGDSERSTFVLHPQVT